MTGYAIREWREIDKPNPETAAAVDRNTTMSDLFYDYYVTYSRLLEKGWQNLGPDGYAVLLLVTFGFGFLLLRSTKR